MKHKLMNFLAKSENGKMGQSFPLDYFLPVYHCVSDERLPHLDHILQYKNVQQFEDDLDDLAGHFQFVTWDEFKDYFKGNFKPKKKIALLTFDDGLREFAEVAAPILERKGIYAINFINPAFIDNQDLMFRCKESLIVDTIKNSTVKNREIDADGILKIRYKDKNKLDDIAEKLGIDFNSYLKQQKPYQSFSQLQDLAKKGFGISAHSWDHPLYHELSTGDQLENTVRSIKYMKENNFLSDSFAFPFTDFGVEKVFFENLFEREQLSYTFGSAGIKVDCMNKNLHRIPMETGESASRTLQKEIAYYQFKKFLNKNIMIRK